MGIFQDFLDQTGLVDTTPPTEGNMRVVWNDIREYMAKHGDAEYPTGMEGKPAFACLHAIGVVGNDVPATGDVEPISFPFSRGDNVYMLKEATIRVLAAQAGIEDNNPDLEDTILRGIRYRLPEYTPETVVQSPGLQTDPGMPIYGLWNREFTITAPRYHQNDYQPNQYDEDGVLRSYEVAGPTSNAGGLQTFDSGHGNLGRCAKFNAGQFYTNYTDVLNKKNQSDPIPDGDELQPFHNTWWYSWDTVPTSEVKLNDQPTIHGTYGYRDHFTMGYSPTLGGYFLRSTAVDPYPQGTAVELVIPASPEVGVWFMLESWMTEGPSGSLFFALNGGEPVSAPMPGGMISVTVPIKQGYGDIKTTAWNFWHRVLEKNERRFVYNNGDGYKWPAWNCRPQMYIVKTQSTIAQGNGVNMTNHWAWSVSDDIDNRVGDNLVSDETTLEIDWTDTDAAPGAFKYIFRGDPDITVIEGPTRNTLYNGERRVIKGKMTDMQAYQAGAWLYNESAAEDEYANMVVTVNDAAHQGLGNERSHSDSYMVKGAPFQNVDYPSHSWDASYPNGTGNGFSGAYMPDNVDHPFQLSRYYPYPTGAPTSISAGHGNLGNAYRFVRANGNSVAFNRPFWPTPNGLENAGGETNVASDYDALFSGGMWVRFQSMPIVGEVWDIIGSINEFWNITYEKAWGIELYNNAGSYEILLQYMDYPTATQQTPLVVPFSIPTNTWFWLDWYHDPVADQIGIALNNGTHATGALVGGFRDWHNYSHPNYRGYYSSVGPYHTFGVNNTTRYPDMDWTNLYWYNYKKLSTAERNTLYGSGNGYTHPPISPYPHV